MGSARAWGVNGMQGRQTPSQVLTEPDDVSRVEADNDVYSIREDRGEVHIVARRVRREIYSRQRLLGGGGGIIHTCIPQAAVRSRSDHSP